MENFGHNKMKWNPIIEAKKNYFCMKRLVTEWRSKEEHEKKICSLYVPQYSSMSEGSGLWQLATRVGSLYVPQYSSRFIFFS